MYAPSVRIPTGLTSSSSSEGSSSSSVLLYVQVELGMYDRFSIVQQPTALCQLNVVQLNYFGDDATAATTTNAQEYQASASVDPTECPHAGVYQWTASYTVPASSADSSLHYTPDVRLTFTNDRGERVGCVVTGPIALRSRADAKAVAGLVALGIAVLVFLGIFAALLFLSHRRKKRLERMRLNNNSGSTNSCSNQSTAASTAMQYQYFRTLPNGQVVPVTGHPPVRQQRPMPQQQHAQQQQHLQQQLQHHHHHIAEDDDDSEDALNISNPAYNETQLPSRPII